MYYLVQPEFSEAAFVASVKVKVISIMTRHDRLIRPKYGRFSPLYASVIFCTLWPLIILISTGSSLQLLPNMALTRIQVPMLDQNTDVK